MPIKDRSLYPANWDEISKQVREAAGNRCQECGVPNHVWGYRLSDGRFVEYPGYSGQIIAAGKVFRIVLTVAHLDHNPANNDPSNLRALCQRCHILHDREQHARNAAETRRRKAQERGQMMLEVGA